MSIDERIRHLETVESTGAGVALPHNLLSATHADSVVNAATRGSLIYGNATPLWDELVLGGLTGSILTRDATDVLWSAFALAGTAGQTYTFPAASGSVPTGTGTAGRVVQWATASTIEDSNLIGPAVNVLTLAATVTATLTVPATGTAALGAGTLTAATANDVTGATHTHAITTTADAQTTVSTILAGDANGGLRLARLGVGIASVAGGINLQNTTTATTGVIFKNGSRFIHNFQHPTGSTAIPDGFNTFIGIDAGNFTMGSTATSSLEGSYNVGVGYQALYNNTTGFRNTATGYQALYNNTTGINNAASGEQALRSNTTGSNNTAVGLRALFNNTTGIRNVGSGYQALFNNTTGNRNTASGCQALFNNTTSNNNTASGERALFLNTTGDDNTATGYEALFSNTVGIRNVASGYRALYNNTTGINNAASGEQALRSNTTGSNNTAVGLRALFLNTTGFRNAADGYQALYSNTTGAYNAAIGSESFFGNTTGSYNVAVGFEAGRYIADGVTANQTGQSSVFIGADTYANADGETNQIVIGYDTTGAGSNTATLGNTSIIQTVLRGRVDVTTASVAAGILPLVQITHLGSGADGDGAAVYMRGKSSTTAAQDMARMEWLWNDATHASRKADLVLSAFDTAEREGIRIRGAGSAAGLGFYGVTPVTRQVLATGGGATVDDVITALQNLGLLSQT